MGCLGSRDSQRQATFENQHWNLPFAFRKAAKTNAFALGPYNALTAGYLGAEKDHGQSDLGELADKKFPADKKDAVAAQAKIIFGLFEKTHDAAAGMENKEAGWMGTFKPEDVKTKFDAALKDIAACFEDLKWPKEEAKPEEEKKEGAEGAEEEKKEEEEQKEGGETKSADDFPMVLLDHYVKSPEIAGVIKSAVMQVELDAFDFFAFDKMGKAMAFFLPKPTEFASCDAILSNLVDTGETAEKEELFGKMRLDDMDKAELADAVAGKDECALMLPGISIWKEKADDCPNPVVGPDSAKEVTISLKKAKGMDQDGSILINRVACKVVNWDEAGLKLDLEADPELKFENLAAAKAYFEKAAGGAASDPAPEKPEGEAEPEKKEEEPKEE